jgi:hypothetical protein
MVGRLEAEGIGNMRAFLTVLAIVSGSAAVTVSMIRR